MTKEYDLVVLGGGTGGYVAAIRASQLGMNVAIVEKNLLGGTCLNEGGIPFNSLMNSAEIYQTLLVENKHFSGTYLYEECIPSKSMMKSAEIYKTLLKTSKFGVETSNIKINFSQMKNKKEQTVYLLYQGVKGLMKKNKIDIFKGHGRILGPSIFSPLPGTISIEHENDEENTMLVPKKIIIAIGSESKEL